jgi:HK97 family phage portal protein
MGVRETIGRWFEREAPPVRVTMIGVPQVGFSTSVTTSTSLGLSAVWRCLDVLSNGVSQLPWREMRGTLELPPSRLVQRPQADRTRREWTSLVVSTLALYDVCYLLKVGGEDRDGSPMGLWPLDPTQVQPIILDSFVMPEEFWVGQSRVTREQLVILHRSPQPSVNDTVGGVLRMARTTFAAALAAEQYASRYWQAGGNPVVALETEAHLNQGEATEVQDRWAERRSRGPDYAPVLSGGLKAHPFGADPTAESAVEARREMVADIGRYFGVPTRMVNAPTGDSETYTSTESANLDLVRFTLQNYIGAIEDAITDQMVPPRRMVMDISPLTRGTQLSRAQAWQLATGNQPWMNVDEVREAENLPPLEQPISIPGLGSESVQVGVDNA